MSCEIYVWDSHGYFSGAELADTDFETGEVLLPPNATQCAPPVSFGSCARWSGNGWVNDTARLAAIVRAKRNRLLFESDWTQLADVRYWAQYKKPVDWGARWSEYRQKLRDVPQQKGFPLIVEFPELPK